MVDWDDKELLINYIRHSFISCDDAGICESVLEPPTILEKPGVVCSYTSEASYDENCDDFDDRSGQHQQPSHSPDIRVDLGHRRRSETSKRLENLKQQRNLQSRLKTVNWKEHEPDNKNKEKWSELFVKKEISPDRPKAKSSAVSELLKLSAGQPKNPFLEYAKFDAHGSGGKNVKIFLTMLSDPEKRSVPLQITIVSTAKVVDLIGLACFHYTILNFEPPLEPNVKRYALYVAEDNGVIDADLPSRSPMENVCRFHFPYLALVQGDKNEPDVSKTSRKQIVNVQTISGDSYTFEFDSLDVPLRTVRDMAVEKYFLDTKSLARTTLAYNLEKLNEAGISLNLDHSLASTATTDFCLVRMNSSRADLNSSSFVSSDISSGSLCTPSVNRFYTITMLHKFKRTSHVQLSIGNGFVDIIPINDKKKNAAGRFLHTLQRSASFRTGKAFHISMDSLGLAEILSEKSNGRKLFQISHRSVNGEWKSLQFEGDASVADDIIDNLNMNLDTLKSGSKETARKTSSSRTSNKSSLLKRLHLHSSVTIDNSA